MRTAAASTRSTPTGEGKTKVAGHPADGYPLDYSPTGKKVTYPHDYRRLGA
jgi:hypothetical protein